MGSSLKSALAAVALLAAAPAIAQNSSDGIVTPGVDKFTLDPARDPTRNPQRAGPEIDNGLVRPLPTVTPPTVVMPTLPAPVRTPPTRTRAPAPRQPVPTETPRPSQDRPATPDSSAATPAPALPTDTGPAVAPVADDNTAESAVENETDVAPTSPADNEGSGWWPWLIGGGLLLLVIAGEMVRRRRPPVVEEAVAVEQVTEAPSQDVPAPIAPPPAPVRRFEEDRARLVIRFVPQSARVTLVGAAVGYRLAIANEGSRAAEDVTLTGMITNADAQQQAVLAQFFTAADTMPGDAIGRIEAGQTIELDGEMRIAHDRIVPIEMQGRKLLIPVVALNVAYKWARDQRIDRGVGRSGAAFIVGQESDPPRERMSPFRLDQGSRQYRTVGARVAQHAVTD